MLIICGGDGTVNQVIQGIYNTNKKAPIGLIPMGTTNDFARSLGVAFNKLDISKNINKYENKEVDVGIINNKIFSYSVTFGIFSKTSYQTSTKWKNRIGRLAYLITAIKEIFNHPIYNLNIQYEDKTINGEFIFGSISNSQYIAGFNMLRNKQVELDDGKFEAFFVKKPTNILQIIKLTLKIINGRFEDENIYCFKTSDISIESTENIQLGVDGEDGGQVNKIEIHNLNKYVDYIVPAK